MPVTYHVVVPFDRREGGKLAAGRPRQVRDRVTAEQRARMMSTYHAGALALLRTGDPRTGLFDHDEVIAAYGDVFTVAAQA